MKAHHTIRNEEQVTKSGWSPWDGVTLQGKPTHTFVRGFLAYADGQLNEDIRGEEIHFDHERGGYWATESGR
jgi:dihydroorotase